MVEKSKIKKIVKNEKLIFAIISALMFLVFINIQRFGDDIGSLYVESGAGIIDYINKTLSLYETWQPRIVINLIILILTSNNVVYFGIVMAISFYVFMYSLSKLFVSENKKILNIIVGLITLMLPFQTLNEAGWISTTVTYFMPAAFGLLALVPVKKIIRNEKIKKCECLLYIVALLVGSSNEQMMGVLLCCYFVSTLYLLNRKKITVFYIVILIVLIISSLSTILCPGNMNRYYSEINTWFSTWESLNVFDKLDIGLSTTFSWLFTNNLFTILASLIMAIIIWNKYQDGLIRTIALVPLFIMVATSLLCLSKILFPNLVQLQTQVPYYGLITPLTCFDKRHFVMYLVWVVVFISIVIEIILICDNYESLLIVLTLLLSGFASRMVMSFSPTIYASGNRTFFVLITTITATLVMFLSENSYILERKRSVVYPVTIALIICAIINIALFVTAWVN